MITHLTIQHYKSVESLDIDLRNVNVLVGKNGAGKSNIIDAIRFVRDAIQDGLDQAITDRHGMENIRQWSPTRPYDVTITLHVESHKRYMSINGSFSLTVSSGNDNYSVKREAFRYTETKPHRLDAKGEVLDQAVDQYEFIRTGDSVKYSHNAEKDSLPFDDTKNLFISGLHGILFNSKKMFEDAISDFESYAIFPNTLRKPQKQSSKEALSSHGDNISSIIKSLRGRRRSQAMLEIISGIQQIVPNLDNVTVQTVGSYIVPRFYIKKAREKGHYFDVDQMSDGTLRVLGILVALYQESGPSVIALEEPELTVHPGVLSMIADAIHEVSENKQVLITTHSPEFLDFFEPDDILAVEIDDGVTKVSSLNPSQLEAVRNDLFSIGELMVVEGLHG